MNTGDRFQFYPAVITGGDQVLHGQEQSERNPRCCNSRKPCS
jgi:hypothetical protein